MTQNSTLRTFLWFSSDLQDALKFYKATFGEGMEVAQEHLENAHLVTADFTIYGHAFIGMSMPGGDAFNNSISLSIQVDGQEETDRLWEAITTNCRVAFLPQNSRRSTIPQNESVSRLRNFWTK